MGSRSQFIKSYWPQGARALGISSVVWLLCPRFPQIKAKPKILSKGLLEALREARLGVRRHVDGTEGHASAVQCGWV